MSIRTILLLSFSALVALLLGMVYVSRLSVDVQRELTVLESRRYESYKLADELRQSSDDLTRMARTYVVTTDPVYEQYFNEILAIRNGEKPRPACYDDIYWDFVLATGERPCVAGDAVALEQLMRDLGFTAEELSKLHEAKSRSDALTRLEFQAMNAVKGRFDDGSGGFRVSGPPDLELARGLMFGRQYHAAKAEIMAPINEFFEMVEVRTHRGVRGLRGRAERLAHMQLWLTLTAVLLAVAAFLFLNRRVIHALHRLVERLKDIAHGGGDLTQRVQEKRRDELGELGKWFNVFVGRVHEIVGAVTSCTLEVTSAAGQIAASARQQAQSVGSFRESTSRAAAAVHEMTTTLGTLTQTMDEVNALALRTAEKATASRDRLDELDAVMAEMSQATGAVGRRINLVSENAGKISLATNTMIKVVDQTSLLSVNAALEAEKAGEHGRGFRVVSREIQRFAEQTAGATLEIEAIVKGIQNSVSLGVAEVEKFQRQMRQGVEQVQQIAEQLSAVVCDVGSASSRFGEIHEAMAAQAAGTDQIRESITHWGEGAGQLSASSSEFAQVTGQLQSVVGRLREHVSSFTVNEASGCSAAPPGQ